MRKKSEIIAEYSHLAATLGDLIFRIQLSEKAIEEFRTQCNDTRAKMSALNMEKSEPENDEKTA